MYAEPESEQTCGTLPKSWQPECFRRVIAGMTGEIIPGVKEIDFEVGEKMGNWE